MPWKPFRRRIKHKPLNNDLAVEETSFDDLLSKRSASDGTLARTSSERFLLTSLNTKSYGTCNGSSSTWGTQFSEHEVETGETLAGIALRYNITIHDIKLANKLYTNEGLWPGRVLRIPVIEVGSTSFDLCGSSSSTSDTMSTASSSDTSRRLSAAQDSLAPSSRNESCNSSPRNGNQSQRPSASLSRSGSSTASPANRSLNGSSLSKYSNSVTGGPDAFGIGMAREVGRRASLEELQDFLSKMDSSIADHKRNTISLINKSKLQGDIGDLDEVTDMFVGSDHSIGSSGSGVAAANRQQETVPGQASGHLARRNTVDLFNTTVATRTSSTRLPRESQSTILTGGLTENPFDSLC